MTDRGLLFNRICHLIALSRDGKVREAVDQLVLATVGLAPEQLKKPQGVAELLRKQFGAAPTLSLLQSSLDRHVNEGRLTRGENGRYVLGAQARANLDERLQRAAELEQTVKEEWLESVMKAGGASTQEEKDELWECLREFIARAFLRHGAETASLLAPDLGVDERINTTLSGYLKQALESTCSLVEQEVAERAVRLYFRETTVARTRYTAQLLDGTFTLFALSADEATAAYLQRELGDLAIFLDTNFVFGLIGLSNNPLADVAEELVEVISSNQFPFQLFIHEETLKEIDRYVYAVGLRLKARRWKQAVSRAAVKSADVSGLERRFHEENAELPIEPEVFLAKYEHVEDLLSERGVAVYREGREHEVERKGKLIAEYDAFLKETRPRGPKPYEALNHDIAVWMTIQDLRGEARSVLDAGAFFLTADYYFYLFDWRVLRPKKRISTVILPNQFLQLLRPFMPTDSDFDRRFMETFALPEVRTAAVDYDHTSSKVLAYLNSYADISEETATRILADEFLRQRLHGVTRDGLEHEVENAIARDNELLLVEKEALRTEATDARAQFAETEKRARELQGQLAAATRARDELQERLRASEQRAVKAEEQVIELKEDFTAEARTRDEDLTGVKSRLRSLERAGRLAGAAVLLLIGLLALAFLPQITDWKWLNNHDNRTGLYALAAITLTGTCWAIADVKRRSKIIWGVVIAALITLAASLGR